METARISNANVFCADRTQLCVISPAIVDQSPVKFRQLAPYSAPRYITTRIEDGPTLGYKFLFGFVGRSSPLVIRHSRKLD